MAQSYLLSHQVTGTMPAMPTSKLLQGSLGCPLERQSTNPTNKQTNKLLVIWRYQSEFLHASEPSDTPRAGKPKQSTGGEEQSSGQDEQKGAVMGEEKGGSGPAGVKIVSNGTCTV